MGDRIDHIIVDRTSKCHPGIVCEGIEYSRGCANNYYIQFSLDQNKGNIVLKKN